MKPLSRDAKIVLVVAAILGVLAVAYAYFVVFILPGTGLGWTPP